VALAALGYAGAAFLPTPPGRIAALALAYVGGMSVMSSIWCLPSMLWRGSAAAAAIAFVNSVGNIGGFAGPVFIGWMQDATGSTRGACLGLAVTALLAAVFYVAQRRRAVFVGAVRAGQLLVRPGAPNAPTAP
jgi:ACS family tartrate transporter-like MFS transporter